MSWVPQRGQPHPERSAPQSCPPLPLRPPRPNYAPLRLWPHLASRKITHPSSGFSLPSVSPLHIHQQFPLTLQPKCLLASYTFHGSNAPHLGWPSLPTPQAFDFSDGFMTQPPAHPGVLQKKVPFLISLSPEPVRALRTWSPQYMLAQ